MNRSCLHSFLLPSPWRGPPGGHLSLEVQPGTTFARDELDCAVQPVSGRAGPCRRARRPGGGCKTTSRTVRAQRGPFGRSSSNRVSPSRALTCSNKGKKKKKKTEGKKKKTSNAPVSYRPAGDPVGRGRGGSRGTVPTPPPPPPEGPVTLTYHCIRDMHWRGRRRRNRTKGAAPPLPPSAANSGNVEPIASAASHGSASAFVLSLSSGESNKHDRPGPGPWTWDAREKRQVDRIDSEWLAGELTHVESMACFIVLYLYSSVMAYFVAE